MFSRYIASNQWLRIHQAAPRFLTILHHQAPTPGDHSLIATCQILNPKPNNLNPEPIHGSSCPSTPRALPGGRPPQLCQLVSCGCVDSSTGQSGSRLQERMHSEAGEQLQDLLGRQTAKESATMERFKTKGGPALREYCQFLTKASHAKCFFGTPSLLRPFCSLRLRNWLPILHLEEARGVFFTVVLAGAQPDHEWCIRNLIDGAVQTTSNADSRLDNLLMI